MNNFDWNSFDSCRVVVLCDTMEKAKHFLEECSKRGCRWVSGEDLKTNSHWNRYGVKTCYRARRKEITYANVEFYEKEGYDVVKWGDNSEIVYGLRDVIANIKNGETWLCGDKKVTCVNKYITIGDETGGITFFEGDTFKKEQKKLNFEEAYKLLKDGHIIKSLCSHYKYQLSPDGKYLQEKTSGTDNWVSGSFDFCEIEGEWVTV